MLSNDPKASIKHSLAELREIDIYQHIYYVGNYIDAKDEKGCWRVAQIKEILDNQVSVTFDGWSHKWDLVNSLNLKI